MAAFSLTTFNLECCKFMPPRQALQSQPQNGRNLDLDDWMDLECLELALLE